jgi:tRNA(Phe) wybutosine-synthesizing methylase Tyw3
MDDSVSEQLAIRVNQQYLVDTNRQLRISIRKEYQKKVEAAIKIQKVFRGHLTRKILQKYVQQEQKNLSEKLANQQSHSVS